MLSEVVVHPVRSTADGVPHAPPLASVPASVHEALIDSIGRALVTFMLARIDGLQAEARARGEAAVFDNANLAPNDKPWQTFENYTAAAPLRAVTAPVTVQTAAKQGLAGVFVAMASLVNRAGKVGKEAVKTLAGLDDPLAAVVRLMDAAVGAMQHHLSADPLCRDGVYPHAFRQKIEALAKPRSNVDPGADALARLYTDFLKVVAWHAATIAYEHEHVTLNQGTLFAILGQLEASVPSEVPVRAALSYVRGYVAEWGLGMAKLKAGKPKGRAAPRSKRAPDAPAQRDALPVLKEEGPSEGGASDASGEDDGGEASRDGPAEAESHAAAPPPAGPQHEYRDLLDDVYAAPRAATPPANRGPAAVAPEPPRDTRTDDYEELIALARSTNGGRHGTPVDKGRNVLERAKSAAPGERRAPDPLHKTKSASRLATNGHPTATEAGAPQ